MTEPKDVVQTRNYMGYTDTACEFYPCHTGVKKEFNCRFCYCPLIAYVCPGPYEVYVDKNGKNRKDCTACRLPHNGIEQSWRFIQDWLENPIIWGGYHRYSLKTFEEENGLNCH